MSASDELIQQYQDRTEYAHGFVTDIDSAKGYDMAVLVTAHKACQEIDWASLASRMRNPILYDGRRVLDLNSLESDGWQVHAVGRP